MNYSCHRNNGLTGVVLESGKTVVVVLVVLLELEGNREVVDPVPALVGVLALVPLFYIIRIKTNHVNGHCHWKWMVEIKIKTNHWTINHSIIRTILNA